ncbi:hypothetical protein OQA88_2171 [Cercophora sp. LCS_1]
MVSPAALLSPKKGDPKAIYILGVGNIGQFVAHSLRKHHLHLPIRLLFHRESLIDEWRAAKKQLTCETNGIVDRVGGFRYQRINQREDGSNEEPPDFKQIHHLIIATKAHATLNAWHKIKHRLAPKAHIVVIQNGMGIIDQLAKADPEGDPWGPPSHTWNWWGGIANAGIHRREAPFDIRLAGAGNLILGSPMVGGRPGSLLQPLQSYLLRTLVDTPTLQAKSLEPGDFPIEQLRKVVVNATINPLTVIFDCKNGELFNTPKTLLVRAVFNEAAGVMWQLVKEWEAQRPDTKRRHAIDIPFDKWRELLWRYVRDIGRKTAENTSSMLQDVHNHKQTEIDYINGYLVREGHRLGIAMPLNLQIIQMVKDKDLILEHEILKRFPFLSDEGMRLDLEVPITKVIFRGEQPESGTRLGPDVTISSAEEVKMVRAANKAEKEGKARAGEEKKKAGPERVTKTVKARQTRRPSRDLDKPKDEKDTMTKLEKKGEKKKREKENPLEWMLKHYF